MNHTKLIERTRRAFSPLTDFGEAGDAKALEIFERMLEHSEAKKAARTMLDFVENHEHLIEVFATKIAPDHGYPDPLSQQFFIGLYGFESVIAVYSRDVTESNPFLVTPSAYMKGKYEQIDLSAPHMPVRDDVPLATLRDFKTWYRDGFAQCCMVGFVENKKPVFEEWIKPIGAYLSAPEVGLDIFSGKPILTVDLKD